MMNFFYQNVDKNGAKPHRSDDFSNGKTKHPYDQKKYGGNCTSSIKMKYPSVVKRMDNKNLSLNQLDFCISLKSKFK
jgi:hypothetical protein